MTSSKTTKLVLGAVLLAGLITTGALVGVASHDQETTEDGFKAYSEDPETGESQIPNPGERLNVELYFVPSRMDDPDPAGGPTNVPAGVEYRLDRAEVITATGGQCDTEDTRTAGMDRGNDLPGTQTDEEMIDNLQETGEMEVTKEDEPGPMAPEGYDHRQGSFLDFWGEEDFAGEPLYFNEDGTEDEGILALNDCTEMPTMEGWYRTWVKFEGQVVEVHDDQYAGEYEEGQNISMWEPSLWYPVVEGRENRRVPMELGPPPGPSVAASDGSQSFANGTILSMTGEIESDGTIVYDDATVPKEDVTSEGIEFDDGFLELNGPIYFGDMEGSNGMIQEDGTIVTADGEEYPPEDQGSAPDDDSADDDGADDDGAGDDDSADGDGADDDGTGDDEDEGTPGDQPGFGAIAALIALSASLLTLKRYR